MVHLLQSTSFWITILTLFVMVIGVSIPAFSLPVNDMAAMIVVVIAAVVAVAINPGDLAGKLSNMLNNKSFWAALLGLLIIVTQIFIPSFNLDTPLLIALCIALVPYILGVAFDPGDPILKVANLLRSRKFWETLVGIAMVILAGFGVTLPFGLTDVQVIGFCALMGALIANAAIEGKLMKTPFNVRGLKPINK